MKTSGHLIFYISENEDFELWKVLSQIPSDDRAAFIKSALKKALIQETNSKNISNNWIKHSITQRIDQSRADNALSEIALEEIGYDAIAASEENIMKPILKNLNNESRELTNNVSNIFSKGTGISVEESISLNQLDELMQTTESMQSNLSGLNFLLNNVIGEENDEKVIDFLRKSKQV